MSATQRVIKNHFFHQRRAAHAAAMDMSVDVCARAYVERQAITYQSSQHISHYNQYYTLRRLLCRRRFPGLPTPLCYTSLPAHRVRPQQSFFFCQAVTIKRAADVRDLPQPVVALLRRSPRRAAAAERKASCSGPDTALCSAEYGHVCIHVWTCVYTCVHTCVWTCI